MQRYANRPSEASPGNNGCQSSKVAGNKGHYGRKQGSRSRWLSSFHREGRKMTGDIKLNKAFLLESIMKIENLAKGRVEEEGDQAKDVKAHLWAVKDCPSRQPYIISHGL